MKNKIVLILSIAILLNACSFADKKSRLNVQAAITETSDLPASPLLEKAITSSINVKHHTMSTLYGNTIAFDYANAKNDGKYPEGAILYQVTWKQKPDSVWFGANIPKEVKSVERIMYLGDKSPVYQLFEGNPLRESVTEKNSSRVEKIAAQKMAVSP